MNSISIESAYIFRITHIENVPWLLQNGVHCRNSKYCDPNFRDIGNPDLINKRTTRAVPVGPGGTLSDYVPFYFTHYSPMLLNVKTGYNGTRQTPMAEIVILVSSMRRVAELMLPFVFTDRHAYLQAAQFKTDLQDLSVIDWKILQDRDFKKDLNDPGKMERYQAEALIHAHVPVSTFTGIACYGPEPNKRVKEFMDSTGMTVPTAIRPGWYF